MLVKNNMPREKLIKFGPESLSEVELLAIILRVGNRKKNVLELSKEILENFNISQDSRKTYDELICFDGVKKAKATQIVALFELARRLSDFSFNEKKVKLNSSNLLYDFVKNDFSNLTEERVMIVLVNSKNFVIKKEFINFGSINYSIIDVRKIIKKVLILDASGFFLIHNHPSGDSSPSLEDEKVTKEIFNLSSKMNIRFLDHIIIGEHYYSFFENDKFNY